MYQKIGSGMEWHVDDALYNPEQIEVVFTIQNSSNCVTKWELNHDKNHSEQENNHKLKRVEVETEANSALFIKAGPNGVPHFVSSLKSGERSILKFVFIQDGSTLLNDAESHVNQFTSTKKKKGKKDKNAKQKKRK